MILLTVGIDGGEKQTSLSVTEGAELRPHDRKSFIDDPRLSPSVEPLSVCPTKCLAVAASR